MRVDKKVKSRRVRLVLLRGIGKAAMTGEYPDSALQGTLAAHFGRASDMAP
jgi:3-dehydroquinate synthetase